MRRYWWFFLSALLCTSLPNTASASLTFEASAGYGIEISPEIGGKHEANIMVAVGWEFMNWVRAEIGMVTGVEANATIEPAIELQLRPMIVISPPPIPVYARLTMAFKNLDTAEIPIAYGGALGLGFDFLGLGAFFEMGLLPTTNDKKTKWIVEGRSGAYLSF